MASFELNIASTAVLLHIRIGNLDWNESHEKKLNIFMLQLSIYYILESEISTGSINYLSLSKF